MDPRTARLIAAGVRRGDAYLYTDRDIVAAIQEMQTSNLFGVGVPTFEADLTALHEELETRIEGTGT